MQASFARARRGRQVPMVTFQALEGDRREYQSNEPVSLPGKIILAGILTAIAAMSVGVPAVRAAEEAQARATAEVRKRIVILYDEDKDDLPGLGRMDRSLRESFRSGLGTAVEIHSESLSLSQFEQAGYDSLVAD